MPEFLSSFPSGFEPLVEELLPSLARGAKALRVSGGMALYRYDGNPASLKRIGLFGNTFAVLLEMNGANFPSMIKAASRRAADAKRFLHPGQTFRVRFHENGRFVKVPSADHAAAERAVMSGARLSVDRVKPDVEFWYIKRSGGGAYYALLIHQREQTEKTLHPGELRPELAQGMCLFAGLRGGDRVLDPFAGYGAIPAQALSISRSISVEASDLDRVLVERLSQKFSGHSSLRARCADARHLDLPDGSIDHIVTDPPWGIHDRSEVDLSGFYADCFAEFRRVLTARGRLTVLSAATSAVRQAADRAEFSIDRQLGLLVNGKKAGLFRLCK